MFVCRQAGECVDHNASMWWSHWRILFACYLASSLPIWLLLLTLLPRQNTSRIQSKPTLRRLASIVSLPSLCCCCCCRSFPHFLFACLCDLPKKRCFRSKQIQMSTTLLFHFCFRRSITLRRERRKESKNEKETDAHTNINSAQTHSKPKDKHRRNCVSHLWLKTPAIDNICNNHRLSHEISW